MNLFKKFLTLFLVISIFFSSVAPTLAAHELTQKQASSSAKSSNTVKLAPTGQSEPNILTAPSINSSDPEIKQAQVPGLTGLATNFGLSLGSALFDFGRKIADPTTNLFKFEIRGMVQGLLLFFLSMFLPPEKAACIDQNQGADFIQQCLISFDSNNSNSYGLIQAVAYGTDYVTYGIDFGTKEYIASLNPFASPVHAQFNPNSTGTQMLTGSILDMWRQVRNFAYIILALILVVIGFMIMLRAQVAPRVIITATNALPKIIMVLIVITFSFPIGALAIDFMKVLLNVVGCSFGFYCDTATNSYIPGIFREVANGLIGTAFLAIGQLPVPNFTGFFVQLFLILTFLILSFVIVIRVGIAIIKEWFMLFMLTLFAPIILLPGAVPGNGAIGRWFKDLTASVLCIVTMYTFIALAQKFQPPGNPRGAGPIIESADPSGLGFELPGSVIGLGFGAINGLEALLTLGILMYVPALCNVIRHALDIAVPTQGAVNIGEAGQGGKAAQSTINLVGAPVRAGLGNIIGGRLRL